jgi:hypothetical protein
MKLYDRPRYAFDEEQLFYHFSSEKERKLLETKTFPWWKPVFNEQQKLWTFVRADGALFNWIEFFGNSPDGIFPEYIYNLDKAATYHWSPVFFIHWSKAVAYDRSLALWRHTEAREWRYGNTKPDKVAKQCDAAVSQWFESLKNCIR